MSSAMAAELPWWRTSGSACPVCGATLAWWCEGECDGVDWDPWGDIFLICVGADECGFVIVADDYLNANELMP